MWEDYRPSGADNPVTDDEIASLVRSVFQEPLPFRVVRATPWHRDEGGFVVNVETARGHLDFHLHDGRRLRGPADATRLAGSSLKTPTWSPMTPVEPEVAAVPATALVERLFPWSAGLSVSGPALETPAALPQPVYRMSWAEVFDHGLVLAMAETVSDLCGNVMSFYGWHEPDAPLLTINLDMAQAVAAASRAIQTLPQYAGVTVAPDPGTLERSWMNRRLRTFWRLGLGTLRDGAWIDAETGELLRVGLH